MIRRFSCVVAVGVFAFVGCRSDDRPMRANEIPVVPEPGPPHPEGLGGGPVNLGVQREEVIDRLANARCQARERCGAVGALREHSSFSECVDIARAELRGSFGAATCDSYDEMRVGDCARRTGDAACGTESKLFDDCVESKLCKR